MSNSLSTIDLACTSLIIKDASKNFYHGRTLEYSIDYPTFLTYHPTGTNFSNLAPDKSTGLSFTAKYDILCLTMPATSATDLCVIEGINSAGLSFSANMYAISATPDLDPADYPRSLPLIKIGDWALASFQSIDELKQAIQTQPVWSPNIAAIGNKSAPFHFIFYDKNGNSVVIEYTDKKLCVHDNPTGVLTNAPELPWHLTNMNNYTMLTNKDVASTTSLGNMTLVQPDPGSSSAALPSDEMSVGRFVRAVYYSSFANIAEDANTAVIELSHIMNKFDRPKNFSVTSPNKYEYTEWTALSDLSQGDLYIRTYRDLNYKKYSLSDYKNQTETSSIQIM